MDNSAHGDIVGMVMVSLGLVVIALLAALAVRGAIAIWRSRSDPVHQAALTADRLAAAIEGDDIDDLTIEERILALATGLKNVKHRVNMLQGTVNKISPPAEKGKGGNGATVIEPERPRSRADIYRDWRSRNAR